MDEIGAKTNYVVKDGDQTVGNNFKINPISKLMIQLRYPGFK